MNRVIKTVVLSVIVLGAVACKSDSTLTIEGELINFTKGKIYLYNHNIESNALVVVDSIEVHGNESFVYQSTITEPSILWMSTSNKDKSLAPLFVTPGETYKLVIDGNFSYNPTLIGSELQDVYTEYSDMAKAVNLKSYEMLNQKIEQQKKTGQGIDYNEYMNKRQRNFVLFKANKAIHEYDSTIIAPYIALYELNAYPKLMDTIYKSIALSVKKTQLGKMLKRAIKENKQ